MLDIFYIQKNFNNFEEFSQYLRWWNLEIYQLQRGKFSHSVRQFSSGEMLVILGNFNGITHQVGDPTPRRTIALLLMLMLIHILSGENELSL